MMNRADFLTTKRPYHGTVPPDHPEVLLFDANLQEFAQKVGYISCLETSGKLPPDLAFKEIEALWTKLQKTKNAMGL
ncbi:hypothetical protein NEA10_06780 [Phormidium yuhuli AB48]|uniref:Uncharacterized protein n=1 Tax=Phormidium yuhuli AB48 TaxID=2940671 RepID=A0ABY5AT56_9CYAN|nr:hypothetical protein [Phormidium yuhuli]USR92417.1 hypothetical protein NEA10_06780 [Phormidium yuhuli AB48]